MTCCGDNDRLSVEQLDVLLERCHTIEQRISLKRLVASAGIYPKIVSDYW
jgi:hypothetical protein